MLQALQKKARRIYVQKKTLLSMKFGMKQLIHVFCRLWGCMFDWNFGQDGCRCLLSFAECPSEAIYLLQGSRNGHGLYEDPSLPKRPSPTLPGPTEPFFATVAGNNWSHLFRSKLCLKIEGPLQSLTEWKHNKFLGSAAFFGTRKCPEFDWGLSSWLEKWRRTSVTIQM